MSDDLFAPPTKEELAAAASKPDLFAPPSKEELVATSEKPGMIESGISGLAHGLTFGTSDKLIAGARAGLGSLASGEDYGPLYDKYLAEMQAHSKQAHAANPWTYFGGNLAGAASSPANALIPGGGLGKNIAGGALIGGVNAAGESEAKPTQNWEQAKKFGQDVAFGAGGGALAGVAGSALGAAAEKLAPKKVAAVMLGAPEKSVERYIENPEAVNAAPSLMESAQNVNQGISNLKDKVISGSKGSREFLKGEDTQFSGADIQNFFKSQIDKIKSASEGALSPDDAATIKFLENEASTFGGENAGKTFSGNRVKDLVQNLQRKGKAGFNLGPGEFATPQVGIINSTQYDVNQALKSRSPEYAKEMVDVADKTNLLNNLQDRFKSNEGLMGLLNRVRRDRAPFAEADLQKLDEQFGTNYVQQLRDSLAKESFNKAATTPGGSRNVNYWRAILGDWGRANHIPFGEAAGAVVGGAIDKYGPSMAKTGIDAYNTATKVPFLGSAIQGVGTMAPNVNAATVNQVSPVIREYLKNKYGIKSQGE